MADALHHPEEGYYARHIRDIGSRGDFSTTVTRGGSDVLGRAIAAWAWAERRAWGWDRIPWRRWDLVEIGAGTGELAEQVLRALGPWKRRGLRFHVVETSAPLRERQRHRLARFRGRVHWHESVGSVLERSGGRAILVSHELVDAFPCRVFAWEAGAWRELHLAWREGRVAEVFEPPEGELPRSSAFRVRAGPGQRVEVFESYRAWWREWAPAWREGGLLTIDYGGTAEEIYRRRPAGTVRGYAFHQRQEGGAVYERFGKQDLTADVNFGDLEDWGVELGLRAVGQVTQAEFLRRWHPRGADSPHADRQGAGGAFRVLHQRPGAGSGGAGAESVPWGGG
jgi:SAM-dependent MidA family methyltransferase